MLHRVNCPPELDALRSDADEERFEVVEARGQLEGGD